MLQREVSILFWTTKILIIIIEIHNTNFFLILNIILYRFPYEIFTQTLKLRHSSLKSFGQTNPNSFKILS
jgi:hypothetical protein